MTLPDTLFRLHGTSSDGTDTTIRKGGRFLSGVPYLWSTFGERAFILPSRAYAEQLLADFPAELDGATIHQRALLEDETHA